MKYRFTVTVTLNDPDIYELDSSGWAIGEPLGRVEHEDVAEYIAGAVGVWGGGGAPDGPFSPTNIEKIVVKGKNTIIDTSDN